MPIDDAYNARKASATYINKVGFYIQDNADDQGWNAAQKHLSLADRAHREGRFESARGYVNFAFVKAFNLSAAMADEEVIAMMDATPEGSPLTRDDWAMLESEAAEGRESD